jgi:hypothetical protein
MPAGWRPAPAGMVGTIASRVCLVNLPRPWTLGDEKAPTHQRVRRGNHDPCLPALLAGDAGRAGRRTRPVDVPYQRARLALARSAATLDGIKRRRPSAATVPAEKSRSCPSQPGRVGG